MHDRFDSTTRGGMIGSAEPIVRHWGMVTDHDFLRRYYRIGFTGKFEVINEMPHELSGYSMPPPIREFSTAR